MTEDGRVYLVCHGCGFFYGDIRLYPAMTVGCPDCGSEAAWAFPKVDKALAYSTHVTEAKRVTLPMLVREWLADAGSRKGFFAYDDAVAIGAAWINGDYAHRFQAALEPACCDDPGDCAEVCVPACGCVGRDGFHDPEVPFHVAGCPRLVALTVKYQRKETVPDA